MTGDSGDYFRLPAKGLPSRSGSPWNQVNGRQQVYPDAGDQKLSLAACKKSTWPLQATSKAGDRVATALLRRQFPETEFGGWQKVYPVTTIRLRNW